MTGAIFILYCDLVGGGKASADSVTHMCIYCVICVMLSTTCLWVSWGVYYFRILSIRKKVCNVEVRSLKTIEVTGHFKLLFTYTRKQTVSNIHKEADHFKCMKSKTIGSFHAQTTFLDYWLLLLYQFCLFFEV